MNKACRDGTALRDGELGTSTSRPNCAGNHDREIINNLVSYVFISRCFFV